MLAARRSKHGPTWSAAAASGNLSAMEDDPQMVLEKDFKSAMRMMAATVTLVTTSHEGKAHGMLATAVTSLSANPPSLLVCINRSASMHGPTDRSRRFCVNLLTREQAELSAEFGARAGGDRFKVGAWQRGLHDLPFVDGAAAAIFCTVEKQLDYGTHTIFVGRIDALEIGSQATPLVYQSGNMGSFVPLHAPAIGNGRVSG